MLVSQSEAFGFIEGLDAGGTGISYIAWIILGLIAGFVASKLMNKTGKGRILDIVLGTVGAIEGGFLVRLLGIGQDVSGLNILSLITAVVGAIVVLLAYHAFRRATV
jgi:uncharacterized membrane protein YeaQ/YmgE (transglycosylase-associated protein family)